MATTKKSQLEARAERLAGVALVAYLTLAVYGGFALALLLIALALVLRVRVETIL